MAVTSSSHAFSYHVFLSFRGSDTRFGFTGNLYNALTSKGIHTFIDDEQLQSGEEITPSLFKAIKESRIAIIVLSKDYASSSFCLDELATIIDCSESKGMLVIPVFYKVNTSDVRHQRGSYGEALTKHEERFQHNPDKLQKLQKWKKTLRQVADLSGYHFKEGGEYEHKFIDEIVAWVSKNINHLSHLSVPDHLVGLETPKAEVMKLLNVGSDDGIHIVGIHGMGGIGKSTLARVVYNYLIAKEKFNGSCYLENVREKSNKHGLEHLQKVVLQEILRKKEINIASVEEGALAISERLKRMKVLLVVDDVNNIHQLNAIVGSPNWFGPGSRVIITTRDKHLLKSHAVERTYEVNELDKSYALQFLTWNAFIKDKGDPTYEEVLNHAVTYASGLPMALEVIASNLFGKTVEEWELAIRKYERIPQREIYGILKVSFDDLEEEEKNVFLDIACCFRGYELEDVADILFAHYGHSINYHIDVLVEKSLIKVNKYGTIEMHNLIEGMGKEIVRQESPKHPGKCSRLWLPEDIIEVLKYKTGTSKIEIVCLDFPRSDKEETIEWDGKAFNEMQNLKTIIIRNGNFSEGPVYLPNSLRVLEWWRYPSHRLPPDFHPKELTICKLPYSHILIELTDLMKKKLVNLTLLNFDGCENLVPVHSSIGFPDNLRVLSATSCNLNDDFFSIGFMRLAHVEHLNLSKNNFTFLPECIKEFQSLRSLDVSNCKHLREIRGVSPNLERFWALNCKSLTSSSTGMWINQELYEAGMKLCCLPGAWFPEWFDHKSRGHSTSFWFRNKFPAKVLCLLIAPVEYDNRFGCLAPMVFINGKVHEPRFHKYMKVVSMEMEHTYLFELHLSYDMFEVPLENEWNYVEVTYAGVIEIPIVKGSGIHLFKHESNNEDIQFFNPYKKIKPSGYDVFLSFSEEDTRHGFTGYLYKALRDSGIHTSIDDEELRRGEEITPETVKAIKESRIAITVLSINYASSSFCLDELASILDCLKRKRLLVLPVFYNMDPSDVRHEISSYGEALAKHEKRFKHNMDKFQKWKMALHQVANLPGFHFKHGDGYEYEFIGRIVEWVSSEINHTPLQVAGYPIGLQSQVLDVMKLLDVGSDDVFMIGICGIGGIGKSTLTREVYNLIADHFDASCFIEKSKKHGLKHLQSILLSKLLGDNDITLSSEKEGISMIQRRLRRKKVLLIFDDVDRHEQLQAVVGGRHWFGSGSKVIITTQDEELLASHDVQRTYKVKELNKNDAFQLLKWKAFKAQYIDPTYEELLNRAVTYASGLPLCLEIIGSNLFGKSVEEWKSAIHQLERSPNDRIQGILKASFDALEEKARSIFLDICCCLNGYGLREIQNILHAHYGHCVKDYIDILVDKSLVKLTHGTKHCYDTITLHDLIEHMGKEIDRQESLAKPDERKRLWLPEDIREVLGIKVSEKHMGKEIERQESLTSPPAKRQRLCSPQDVREVLGYNMGIEIICLDFPTSDKEETIEWDGKAFQNMQNLKTIIIRNGNFSKGPEYLPNSLRVLEWWRYPSQHLPSDFHPKELTICKLPYSHISTIELTNLMKKFNNLRVLEFSSANV